MLTALKSLRQKIPPGNGLQFPAVPGSFGRMQYRTKPEEIDGLPSGIPHIIGNEAAERFSFYGMQGILAIFFSKYLYLMDGSGGTPMDAARSTELVHLFN